MKSFEVVISFAAGHIVQNTINIHTLFTIYIIFRVTKADVCLASRNHLHFMEMRVSLPWPQEFATGLYLQSVEVLTFESECSLQRLQQPVTRPYPEPHGSVNILPPCLHTIHFNIILSSIPRSHLSITISFRQWSLSFKFSE
jgi:hypothetical protein